MKPSVVEKMQTNTYTHHLQHLKNLRQEEVKKQRDLLISTTPNKEWPYGFPASLDPKLIIIGVSPGNSPYQPKEENKAQSFRANFENWQIDILTQCINEARIFSKTITSDTMNEIFMCTLKQPLIIANRKNKLFAYFFTALDDRSLIVEDWQSLSARKSLFLSYNGTLLKQNDYSSAVYSNRTKEPKYCHIIDKYIKQLKKD